MDGVKLPKNGRRAPKGITLEDLQKLLRAAEESMCPERDRALLLFLADTGCRVGGLVGLTLADLNVRRRWALVTEKFNKSRSVFFSEVTAEALRDWLEVRLEWDIGGDWVFLSHHGGGQLMFYGVNQLLTRLKERGGAEGRCQGLRTCPQTPSRVSARIRALQAGQYLMNGGDLPTATRRAVGSVGAQECPDDQRLLRGLQTEGAQPKARRVLGGGDDG
jgi:integrase